MSPQSPAAIRRDEKSPAPGVMDGQRYIESLRDGREVWLHGGARFDLLPPADDAGVVAAPASQHRNLD
jgi:hypothetical protein